MFGCLYCTFCLEKLWFQIFLLFSVIKKKNKKNPKPLQCYCVPLDCWWMQCLMGTGTWFSQLPNPIFLFLEALWSVGLLLLLSQLQPPHGLTPDCKLFVCAHTWWWWGSAGACLTKWGLWVPLVHPGGCVSHWELCRRGKRSTQQGSDRLHWQCRKLCDRFVVLHCYISIRYIDYNGGIVK